MLGPPGVEGGVGGQNQFFPKTPFLKVSRRSFFFESFKDVLQGSNFLNALFLKNFSSRHIMGSAGPKGLCKFGS